MIRRLVSFIAHFLFWLSSLPGTFRFFVSARNSESAQRKILSRIIKGNSNTEFGIKNSFASIKTPEDFQTLVPVRTYEDFLPFIESVARGSKKILTDEEVRLFEPTSGSSSSSKLIPYTTGLKEDFRKGLDPWIFSLYFGHPELFGGSVYWSITPSHSEKRYTESGIPVGFAKDQEYFGGIQKWVLDTIMAVPSEVKNIKEIADFRYCTLLFLVSRRDLRLISVWNPTYLSLLLKDLETLFSEIISDFNSGRISRLEGVDEETRGILERRLRISSGRIRELEAVRKRRHGLELLENSDSGRNLYEEIWPELKVISCWCDGNAEYQVGEIKKMFSRAEIQPKGLLSTEALVSFPFFGEYSLLSVNSHFFEFEEWDGNPGKQKFFPAHQLQKGKQYKVVVTTNGGLYRYALGDIVEICDFWKKVPVMRFVGRSDKVVDLVGEKLNEILAERFVGETLKKFDISPLFWMVAPQKLDLGCYRYTLFMELRDFVEKDILVKLAEAIDGKFKENYHYRYARILGQLSGLGLFLIDSKNGESAGEIFIKTSYRLGQQLGSIKNARLHRYEDWAKEFSGIIL